MSNKIKLGYEIKTGKKIEIEPSHLIVTGLSQKAGKTTTLESLIKRSGSKAIVFRTKIGEKSFLDGTVIPPYYKEKSDWQYIESLIEATMKEKVGKLDRAIIIKLSKMTNGKSLLDFKKIVDNRLLEKINTFESMLLTNLQAYLEIVLPKLQTIQFSNELQLVDGLNIVNLERFSRDTEVQSLIISSILEEILYNHKGVIVIIPEAWKFIPQKRGSPCKNIVEEFIRQGATNKNYLWIDSQDMTGVDKIPLKQISEWILGYQSEKNEVKHTLDQIPLPKSLKPKEEDIMRLGTGVFIYASRDLTAQVYIQPFWLDDEKSIQIAKGEIKISEIDAPKQIAQNKIAIIAPEIEKNSNNENENNNNHAIKELKGIISKELLDIRTDFFNKIGDLQDQINKIFVDIAEIKTTTPIIPDIPEIDEDVIVSKVLQKMPTVASTSSTAIDIESITKQVLSRIPKSSGSITYDVLPLEKIQKEFLEECKQKILSDISGLNDKEKKTLKYLESIGHAVFVNEIVTKCFFLKSGGSNDQGIRNALKTLENLDMNNTKNKGKHNAKLKEKITILLGTHNASESEIENLYQHIIMELL